MTSPTLPGALELTSSGGDESPLPSLRDTYQPWTPLRSAYLAKGTG